MVFGRDEMAVRRSGVKSGDIETITAVLKEELITGNRKSTNRTASSARNRPVPFVSGGHDAAAMMIGR